jgi:hypothetical protein
MSYSNLGKVKEAITTQNGMYMMLDSCIYFSTNGENYNIIYECPQNTTITSMHLVCNVDDYILFVNSEKGIFYFDDNNKSVKINNFDGAISSIVRHENYYIIMSDQQRFFKLENKRIDEFLVGVEDSTKKTTEKIKEFVPHAVIPYCIRENKNFSILFILDNLLRRTWTGLETYKKQLLDALEPDILNFRYIDKLYNVNGRLFLTTTNGCLYRSSGAINEFYFCQQFKQAPIKKLSFVNDSIVLINENGLIYESTDGILFKFTLSFFDLISAVELSLLKTYKIKEVYELKELIVDSIGQSDDSFAVITDTDLLYFLSRKDYGYVLESITDELFLNLAKGNLYFTNKAKVQYNLA